MSIDFVRFSSRSIWLWFFRYITSVPDFYDRIKGKHSEYKMTPIIELQQIKLDMEQKRKEAELEKKIDNSKLKLRQMKLNELLTKIENV